MEPGECRTTHSDPTSRRTAFRVGPLCSTSLPHRGYVGNSSGPACTVPGGLAELPRPSRWLLRTIRLGYAIQFARRPPKFRGIRFTSVLNNDAPVLRAEVAVLLAKDAIEPVSPAEMKSGFYSPYFIVPKKGSGLRPILDLRVLNRAQKLPFRMLTQRRIFQCVRPFDLICSDRPEGCLLPCLSPPSTQTVLRFAFEGRAYQCKALPFGLSMLSLEHCCANTGIWFLVTSAGWGFRSTEERANSPLRRGSGLGQPHSTSLKGACSVNAEMPGVFPAQEGGSTETFSEAPGAYGILSHGHAARIASYETASALASRWAWRHGTYRVSVTPSCRTPSAHGRTLLSSGRSCPRASIQACCCFNRCLYHGLGGAMCNGHAAAGLWTGPQLQWHINCLELLAVWLALRRFKMLLHEKHVLVRTDNTATVAYINHQGGLRSLRMSQLARHLLLWNQKHLRLLRAVHVPGKLNRAADELSHQPALPGE